MNPQQLRQLEQAATPGPWMASFWPDPSPQYWISQQNPDQFSSAPGAQITGGQVREHDAALITSMRNLLPHLIELWEAAQALNAWAFRAQISASEPGDFDRLDAALARLDNAE